MAARLLTPEKHSDLQRHFIHSTETKLMRTYPTNSPAAATRILALALFADGHVSKSELLALHHPYVCNRLGVSVEEMKSVVQTFCEDLFISGTGRLTGMNLPDSVTRQLLLSEITDPRLQKDITVIFESLIKADQHVSEGETEVQSELWSAWNAAHTAALMSGRNQPVQV
jgi:hypothetical protein